MKHKSKIYNIDDSLRNKNIIISPLVLKVIIIITVDSGHGDLSCFEFWNGQFPGYWEEKVTLDSQQYRT